MSHVRRRFQSVPDVIEANNISVGSEVPSGIISKIRSLVSNVTSYVNPTSTEVNDGDVNTLVDWDNFVMLKGETAYAQVEFKHGYVYPTSYSLKGYNDDLCFAKEWKKLFFQRTKAKVQHFVALVMDATMQIGQHSQ